MLAQVIKHKAMAWTDKNAMFFIPIAEVVFVVGPMGPSWAKIIFNEVTCKIHTTHIEVVSKEDEILSPVQIALRNKERERERQKHNEALITNMVIE